MKVLFLGYRDSPLVDFLREEGEEVIVFEEEVDPLFIKKNAIDLIICYGYRHIIEKDVLEMFSGKIINLHISYLPYNRGADPNFWSFREGTPKGVTIHLIDKGIDTGDVLLQELIELSDAESLRSTYDILQIAVQKLFINNWIALKEGKIDPKRQIGRGTYHRSSDKEQLIAEIKDQWLDIPIAELINKINTIRS
jgi:methionyl-tRNA formyltransferase